MTFFPELAGAFGRELKAGLSLGITTGPTVGPSAADGNLSTDLLREIAAYLAPEPGAAQFVDVGSRVSQGQTLLIIEAMKTMNHIPAPRAGVVTAVLVGNGQPVEFGEPLVIIE